MRKVNVRRTLSDGKSSHCLWQGELITCHNKNIGNSHCLHFTCPGVIMSPKRSLGDILCLLRFLLLLFFFFFLFFFLPSVKSLSYTFLVDALIKLYETLYEYHAMWSCTFKAWFFQNGCRCHGNGQNAKKMNNTKIIIAGYSPNRNWWNLIGTTSTSSGTS